MTKKELNSSYWNELYKNGETPWNLGAPSLPLKTYIDTLSDKSIAILVPGAGNAYEAEYLIEKGFTNVTILDYAADAIDGFRKRVPMHAKAHLICENFFGHEGSYDLILEQTFFCALDPALRKDYGSKMHKLLKPEARLVGLLFTEVPNTAGPPFGGSVQEYTKLFREDFIIEKLETCYNSIKPRAGRELFFKLLKK